MIHKQRACGMAAMFIMAVIWPVTSVISTERVAAAAPVASVLWLAPSGPSDATPSAIATAVDDVTAGRPERALTVLTAAARENALGGYALLYLGRAQLGLDHVVDARATATKLLERASIGYMAEASLWFSADVSEAEENWSAAAQTLRQIVASNPLEPARAGLRLGRAAAKAGNLAVAVDALDRVYFDFPLSAESADAAADLARLGSPPVPSAGSPVTPRFLTRAKALYDAKHYADARSAFVALRPAVTGDERALTDLRIASCDYFSKRYAAARDELVPLLTSVRSIDAEFLYLSTLRELGRSDEYLSRARAFVDAHPSHPLAEEALNDLATHYVLANDDEKAAATLADLYSRFPTGVHADRAAWRTGWWDYKAGKYGETIRVFESAAETFPHDDYRPSWLYWAARAHLRRGDRDAALAGFQQVVFDYRNSYYGREAIRAMAPLVPTGGKVNVEQRTLAPAISPGDPPPNAAIISELLRAGLYDTAVLEVRKAELVSGSSPMLEATLAYALNKKGDLRDAISKMRRAYPQFLAEGGETLPEDLRRVIFPIAYWSVISRQALKQNLDPYLMAALVAQESTFQPGVKSVAGAWGLMQIEPGTGRGYATKLHIRPYSTASLTQPEINVQIGMATFSDLLHQFGSTAAALAAYNAGDSRVARWLADRHDLEQDEFIDDIPFPETQNYVKRILGTAEDYRNLYSGRPAAVVEADATPARATTSAVSTATKKPAPKTTTTSKTKKATKAKKSSSASVRASQS